MSGSDLLGPLLKQVSRSFYLTLRVLPPALRAPLGVSYLFARAADTIADTDLIQRERRLELLRAFKDQFAHERADPAAIRMIQDAVAPHQASAERALLLRLHECLAVYGGFPADDRGRVQWLMTTLPNGMEMDLTVFGSPSPGTPVALATLDDLDRYIYYVAGCVGDFWTRMAVAHVPALSHWDANIMAAIGVRFGKGLQLTNVLKDLPRDLQRGRCYIPMTLLQEAGLKPADLLRRDSLPAFRPTLTRLLTLAREHLDQGWLYTLAIPRREFRLRLACMWPILFAGRTLERIAVSPDLLDPSVNIKMPKGQVYRIMALTTGSGACTYVGTAYWAMVRKRIV